MNTQDKLTTKRMFGYCAGDIFGGGAFTLVGLLFMNFLTDNIYIGAAAVGTMMLVGKIWDAFIDPFIGSLSERVRSKVGRRRIFFLAGIFHIAPAFALLWLPLETLPLWFKIIYYTFAYMLFATSFSLTMVPYHAMLPELTTNIKKRNRTVGIRAIFSNCSTLIAGTVPMMLVNLVGKEHSYAYLVMALCFGVFYAIPWIFVFLSTKEIDHPGEAQPKEKVHIFKDFFSNAKMVLRNRSFRIMLGLYLLAYTGMDIFMAILMYYVKWFLNMPGSYTILLGIFLITQILSIFIYIKLANVIGKRFAFVTGASIWAIGLILMLIMASATANPIMVYIPTFIMALGAGGVAYLPWAMLPEVMDVEELISGKKKDGIYSGFLTFIRQLSQAIALFIVGIYLDTLDYSIEELAESCGGNNNSCIYAGMDASIKNGIRYFAVFAPFILLIASLTVATLYPINNLTYPMIRNEITNRNTTDESVKKHLEEISGQPFEKLGK